MTPFASVAMFKRAGKTMFLPPRKELVADATQARKAASRYWNNRITGDDVLTRVVLVRASGPLIEISERAYTAAGPSRNWLTYTADAADAVGHIRACLAELGVDPERAPPPMPETLEINGILYRREI